MLTNPIYEKIRSIILNLNNLAMTEYCYGENQDNLKKLSAIKNKHCMEQNLFWDLKLLL
jgi:hypothetical protein